MKILFVHNNFPGQYRRLYEFLNMDDTLEILSATLHGNSQQISIRTIKYGPKRAVAPGLPLLTASIDRSVTFAEAVESSLHELKSSGWVPDVICFHSGWGVGMYLRDVFPNARIIGYMEWYYNINGADIEFLMGDKIPDSALKRAHGRNASILLDMSVMDWGVSPTRWQRSQLPRPFRDFVDVLHDGIDTNFMAPDPSASFVWEGVSFKAGDPIITYVARGLEPYRGFPSFMSAVQLMQRRHPNLRVIIVGADRVAYGPGRSDGRTYKDAALSELDLDMGRIHFLGNVSLAQLRKIFQVSFCHVYLTVPFVLSWSMLEAMACGCYLIASDTRPVTEVVEDGVNGILINFDSPASIADAVTSALEAPDDYRPLRHSARQTILRYYSATSLLQCHRQLILDVYRGIKTLRGSNLP